MYRVTKTNNMYRKCESGKLQGAGREILKDTLVELLFIDGDCAKIKLPDRKVVYFPSQYLALVDAPPDSDAPAELFISAGSTVNVEHADGTPFGVYTVTERARMEKQA